MRRERLIYLGLALITLLLYSQVLFSDFVNYDDPDYVSENPMVQRGLSWEGVVWAFTTGHMGNWHPLTWLSHMLDWQLFGDWAGGHHWVNVLLHVANALLLLRLLQSLTGSLWRSALVAALFAWHPLRVESVAWIAERKDVLSTLFFLLALGAYCRRARQSEARSPASETEPKPEVRGRSAWRAQAPAWGWYVLSLLSKPMFVTLPVVLLLLDFWPLRRMRVARGDASGENGCDWRGLLAEKVPFFVLALVSSIVTLIVQQRGGSVSALDAVPLGARVANALAGYVAYLGKLFWPVDLAVIYPMRTHWAAWKLVVAGAILLCVTLAVFARARQQRYAVVGWLWFLATLLPVIGLVQVGLQFIADRYTYVPAVGVFIMLAWGAAEWVGTSRNGRWAAGVVSGLALAACLAVSWRQVSLWQDGVRLFAHTVAVTERNYLAHNNLGHALAVRKRLDEARHHFEKALEYEPNYAQARRNLGTYYRDIGQLETALEHYELAVRLKPGDVTARGLLGSLQSQLGRKAAALETYREAVRLNPDSARARLMLGIELVEQGQVDEAVSHYQAALRRAPSAEVNYHLGNALLRLDRLPEAIARFRAALDLNPKFAEAHNNLANALAQHDESRAAIAHLRTAVTLKPDYAEALHNLGVLLTRAGESGEAAEVFERLLKLEPDNERAHFELALIQIEARQSEAAIRHLREALRLRPASPIYAHALARVLATAPQAALRDGAEAVRLAQAVCAASQRQNPYHLDTLAAAYAQAGRFDDAVSAQREAIVLATSTGKTNVVAEFEKHLKLYADRQAYREPDR